MIVGCLNYFQTIIGRDSDHFYSHIIRKREIAHKDCSFQKKRKKQGKASFHVSHWLTKVTKNCDNKLSQQNATTKCHYKLSQQIVTTNQSKINWISDVNCKM